MEARRYIPHYTVDDYERWEGEWELWHGVPVAMTPSPNARHQFIAGNLYGRLRDELRTHDGCDCRVVYELDWRIATDTVVCPDISVVCEPIAGNFIERAPTLVAEILSPATADKDRTAKRDLYAQQGVAFYLIADPVARRLTALRLVAGAYEPVDDPTPRFDLHDGCAVVIDPAGLWD